MTSAAATGALAAVLLTGCGSSPPAPQQTFADYTPAVTPTATPSLPASIVTVDLPTRPVEMERSDEVGATAAATYFMHVFSYVIHSGDLDEWDRISAAGCDYCSSVRAEVARVYGGGGSFAGGEMTVQPAEVLGQDPVLGGFGIGIAFEMTEGAELDSLGSPIASKSAERGFAVVDTAFSPNGWLLVGLSLGEDG